MGYNSCSIYKIIQYFGSLMPEFVFRGYRYLILLCSCLCADNIEVMIFFAF